MHRTSFFVCIPIFRFHLSIDLGRLVGSMPLRCQKKYSRTLIQHRRRTRRRARWTSLLSCFIACSLLRIALYTYIYCSFGRLSIELYSPLIMIDRYTPRWSLPLDNHGPVKIGGRNGGGLVLPSSLIYKLLARRSQSQLTTMDGKVAKGGGTPSRILSEYAPTWKIASFWLFGCSYLYLPQSM